MKKAWTLFKAWLFHWSCLTIIRPWRRRFYYRLFEKYWKAKSAAFQFMAFNRIKTLTDEQKEEIIYQLQERIIKRIEWDLKYALSSNQKQKQMGKPPGVYYNIDDGNTRIQGGEFEDEYVSPTVEETDYPSLWI